MVMEDPAEKSEYIPVSRISGDTNDARRVQRPRVVLQQKQSGIHEQMESFGGGSGGSTRRVFRRWVRLENVVSEEGMLNVSVK